MPISQQRMIALINSGLDYKQAYESTRAAIEQHFAAAMNEEESWESALEAIWAHTKPATVIQDTNSAVVLALEYQHFKVFKNRNTYAAKYAREQRDKAAYISGSKIAGAIEAEQPERFTSPTKPKPAKKSKPAITSTDAQQVNSNSDLFEDGEITGQPDEDGMKAAQDFVALEQAKAEYAELEWKK